MAKRNSVKGTPDGSVDFLNEFADEGFENLDSSDFVIPFLRILQKLSPQVDKDSDEHVSGAQAGLFYNTVNQKIYGKTIEVIPLVFKKAWLEWGPNRGGLMGRHEPHSIKINTSNFTNWHPVGENSENSIVETMLFFILIIGHFQDGPIVFPLSKSGIKHGKNWNTNIMMTRLPSGQRAPYYSSVWEMETVLNKNDQGNWFQVGGKKTAIVRERFITAKEFKDHVFPMKNSLKKIASKVDFTQIEDGGESLEKDEKGDAVPF